MKIKNEKRTETYMSQNKTGTCAVKDCNCRGEVLKTIADNTSFMKFINPVFMNSTIETVVPQTSSNFDFFNDVLTRRLALITQVLGKKGLEYSTAGDRFSNFREAATIEEVSTEKALLGMMVKHEVSVRDIVKDLDAKLPSAEMIEEKIGDWINYLILLEGLIKERIETNGNKA